MNFKRTLLASASAVVLLGAASGGALAQTAQIQQNQKAVPAMPNPTPTLTVNQLVDGAGNGPGVDASDTGSRRVNTIDDDFSDGLRGISHDQQNNGSNNAMGIASNVVVNAVDDSAVPGEGDVTQDLGLRGITRNGEYSETASSSSSLAVRRNLITEAYDGVAGIVNVQQNNGDGNVMGIGDVVSANLGGIGTADVFDGAVDQNGIAHDDATMEVLLDARVQSVTSTDSSHVNGSGDTYGERRNEVTNTFDEFVGMASVQQNNGNGNVIQAGNAVVADILAAEGPGGKDTDIDIAAVGLVSGNSSNSTAANANPTGLVVDRLNLINNTAFDDAQGIVNVQQNNGDNNAMNVGNAVRASIGVPGVSGGDEDVDLAVKAQATVAGNTATSSSVGGPPPPPDRENEITNAFKTVEGVVNAQQNNGDNNSMNVANGIVAVLGSADDIDDVNNSMGAAIAGVTNNTANDSNQNRSNAIEASAFHEAAGVMTAQQNNGDNNGMNVATAIVATIDNTSVNGDDANSFASAAATVTGNTATTNLNVDRTNVIDSNAFNDASGVATVQQNNGDNNAINAAKSIAVAIAEAPSSLVGFNGDVMADTAITAVVTGNTATIAYSSGTPGYENTLTDSFHGFAGVKTVQQNNGSNNAIQSSISVVANVVTN